MLRGSKSGIPMQPDAVAVEAAYAEALREIAQLQERVIHGRALIASLKREVCRGCEGKSNARNVGGDDSAHDFSD